MFSGFIYSAEFFFYQNSILFVYMFVCVCIYSSLINKWLSSIVWLLQIMLARTLVLKFKSSLGRYLEVELLSHVVSLCVTFQGTARLPQ